ncbi:hypothetical protein BDV12DRAFT_202131 [Aspergillus spectabilis]
MFKYAAGLLPLATGVLGAGTPRTPASKSISPHSTTSSPPTKIELLVENSTYSFAHEAPVYIPSTGDLFVVGNYQTPNGGAPIEVSRVFKNNSTGKYVRELIHPDVPMANGAISYQDGILFCAQGTLERKSALIWMNITAPYDTRALLDNFKSRRFNSLNDLFIHSNHALALHSARPLANRPNKIRRGQNRRYGN